MSIVMLLQSTVYAVIVFGIMYAAKRLEDFRTVKIDDDRLLDQEGNLALAFRRAGLNLAIGFALLGALSGKSSGFSHDILHLFIDGLIIVPVLMVARYVNDVVLLRGIDNDDAIVHNNVAVGITEFGNLTATGLIMGGLFVGEGGNYISLFVFAVLGQLALMGATLAYKWFTPFSLLEEIKEDNASAGITLGGTMLALGIILRACVSGDSMGFKTDLINFVISALFGIALLRVLRWAVDLLFVPQVTLADAVKRDHNSAVLLLTYGTVIAIAVLIAAVI